MNKSKIVILSATDLKKLSIFVASYFKICSVTSLINLKQLAETDIFQKTLNLSTKCINFKFNFI